MNTSKFVSLRRATLLACLCAATGSWAQTAPAAAKPAAKAAGGRGGGSATVLRLGVWLRAGEEKRGIAGL